MDTCDRLKKILQDEPFTNGASTMTVNMLKEFRERYCRINNTMTKILLSRNLRRFHGLTISYFTLFVWTVRKCSNS